MISNEFGLRYAGALFAASWIYLWGAPAVDATSMQTVTVTPGENIQSVIDSHIAGTTYVLSPGTYRQQSLTPHSGDTFVGSVNAQGQLTAVLSGLRLSPTSSSSAITGWRQAN